MTTAAAWSDCPQKMLFRVGAHTLAIDVDHESSRAVLDSTYALLRCPPGPRTPHCSAAIRRLADGRFHARFGRQALPVAARPANGDARTIYMLAREMFARCAASQNGSMAFYSALVGTIHGAVLLLGPAGIGKSVLAVHLARGGATFLGDETSILSLRTADIAAVPRRPALRESALHVLPEPLRERVLQAPHVFQTEHGRFWYSLDEEDIGFAPSDRTLPLRAVCLISGRGDAFAMRSLNAREALPAILQRAYARRAELAETAALRAALRSVSCFDVTLSDPETSAKALLDGVSACV